MRHGELSKAAVVLLGAAASAGCGAHVKNMRPVESVNTVAAPNESVIVFLRPSHVGFAIQSAVWEVMPNQPSNLVGIVAAKKKVVYRTAPGTHLFMVTSENADFMEARLEPGRTYYALVTPRMGVWRARFSLRPVHIGDSLQLPEWQRDTGWVELDETSARWAAENLPDIEERRARYFNEWLQKQPFDRPVLMPEDAQ
jgi:hypothetical protein